MAKNLHEYFDGIFVLNISAVYLEGNISAEYLVNVLKKNIISILVAIILAKYLPYNLPDEFCHVVRMTSVQLCQNMNFTESHL